MNVTDLPPNMQSKIQITETGCWDWIGARTPKGYGKQLVARRTISTHRRTYELLVGPIPAGLEIDHICRVRSCCNPAHLEPVTHLENLLRARKDTCCNGHKFTPENTRWFETKEGYEVRACITCKRVIARKAKRRYRERQREMATS